MELLNVVTPPSFDDASLTDVKNFLRVDITDDDALITGIITAAMGRVANLCSPGRTLYTTTYDYILDGFPNRMLFYNHHMAHHNPVWWNWIQHQQVIPIPRPPLQSVTSVTYYDQSNTLTTLDPSVYRVLTGSETQGFIVSTYNERFPLALAEHAAVTIRFVAGFGTGWNELPEALKLAVRGLCGHWYNHREAVSDLSYSQVPEWVDALCDPYKVGWYR